MINVVVAAAGLDLRKDEESDCEPNILREYDNMKMIDRIMRDNIDSDVVKKTVFVINRVNGDKIFDYVHENRDYDDICSFVVQDEQNGFGDAVFCAKSAVLRRFRQSLPLLVLRDDTFLETTNPNTSGLGALIAALDTCEKSILGTKVVHNIEEYGRCYIDGGKISSALGYHGTTGQGFVDAGFYFFKNPKILFSVLRKMINYGFYDVKLIDAIDLLIRSDYEFYPYFLG